MSSSRKRQNPTIDDDSSAPPTSPGGPPSSLLPSSPPLAPFEDAEEERELALDVDDLDEMAEEEAGEDLFGDNLERDYRDIDTQDAYDINDANIDDRDQAELDAAARRQVDARLNRRDAMLRSRRGMPSAFIDDPDDDDIDLLAGGWGQRRRRRRNNYDEDIMDDEEDDDPTMETLPAEALQDVKAASVAEWILIPSVSRTIAREFQNFLVEFTDESGRSVYGSKIRQLGEVNSESLDVSFEDLANAKPTLAKFLAIAPSEMLEVLDNVAMKVIQLQYPDYPSIHADIHVRLSHVPLHMNLRELREQHLNALVRVTGVVTRRTGVFPQLKYIKFNCVKCNELLGPYPQEAAEEVKVSFCSNCQSRGPFKVNSEQTVYRNYQKLTLQESPGSVPAGRLPRHREVILLWDLIDSAKPGDEIEVTGIYRNSYDAVLNAKQGFPVFATIIEANSVARRDGYNSGAFDISDEDERAVRKIARERGYRVIEYIINSIAPSIYGHKDLKTAIACSLFGGVEKSVKNKHRIRGDINVLLLGDPGTAKSQLLKYAEQTAHRAVFATGQGASAVGLTASVRKDPITREWTLEGGALVLADRGTCMIDEFDKMNDQDRTSIHEAMEQQSISISKAGIVTTLQARCSIIAAANPNGGRYNATLPFSDNVDLTEPILSRFDIMCVVRDLARPEDDERLAKFVVTSHMRSHGGVAPTDEGRGIEMDEEDDAQLRPESMDQELLKKYIHFARTRVNPVIERGHEEKLASLYSDLREESKRTGSGTVTVRLLESMMRIAESFARMRLSLTVSEYDVDRAIRIQVKSFIGAQKISVRRALERSFAKYL